MLFSDIWNSNGSRNSHMQIFKNKCWWFSAKKGCDGHSWLRMSVCEVEEFKYAGVLFMSEGKCEINRVIGTLSAVL